MKKLTPEQKNIPGVKDMVDDLEKISSIEAVSISEGGKKLVAELVKDIVGSVETLCSKYSTLTVQEFVSLCADMKSKIDLTRVITRSKKNKDYLEQLISDTIKE